MMRRRDIYLKIEQLLAYSPVAPDDAEHHRFRVDCMHGMHHEDGTIPAAEVERRRLDAVVFRRYRDAAYTDLETAPLIGADINEPRPERRIPGAFIFTEPGERLYIHVLNGDSEPHSLHMHGLVYGIDSDGSWPFGVAGTGHHGGRSDEICPGEQWCYVFDATEDTVGAWPFHGHHMHIDRGTNRGLFGGVVVRDPNWRATDYEVPLFLHRLTAIARDPLFASGILQPGAPAFSHTFTAEGTYDYVCELHPMHGTVRVTAGAAATATVSIRDNPGRFDPADVQVGLGGTVTWTHAGQEPHTVSESGGAGLLSYALNGRAFVGNTPTIRAETGKRIRWYVFNLDFGENWHNFHLHGQRWRVGNEVLDTRTLGPAESFVADSVVPPVVLLPREPCDGGHEHDGHQHDGHDHDGREHSQHRHDGHEHGHGHGEHPHPDDGSGVCCHHQRRIRIRGDFLVHCHVEMHMMEGMAAVVRAVQHVDVTPLRELVVVSPNGEWIGLLESHGSGLAATWIKNDWVNEPGGTGATGWDLKQGDTFTAADIDGDGRQELVVVSADGAWIGVLKGHNGGLAATWIRNDWINEPGGTGATGWHQQQGDHFLAADIDGDGRDELVVVSADGQWIGVLRGHDGGLAASWIGHDWVNEPGGSGASGWDLKQGDAFYPADVDGDGRDELIVVSPNGQWIGVLKGRDGGLAATWIKDDWVNEPGGSGASGWDLKKGDRYFVADVDADCRDELIVVSPNGQWIGLLEHLDGGLAVTWIKNDWVNEPGGAGASGWDLQPGDRYLVADVDGDGREELVVVSPNGQWIGRLEQYDGGLAATWIKEDWVNEPGGAGASGWDLKQGDLFVVADIDGDTREENDLGFTLPLDSGEHCPHVMHDRCAHEGEGRWERLPDSPIFIVHAAVMHTGKVLLFAGTAEVGDPLESRVFDPQTGTMTTQLFTEDLFCAGHAFLADGRVCVAGGAPAGTLRSTHIFDPATETWTKVSDMNRARWYPTVLTLSDGRILAASGSGVADVEIYDPAANSWQLVTGASRNFPELYPSLHLLPSGHIFYSRAGWAQADTAQTQTAYLTLTGPLAGTWTSLGQQQFYDRQEGTAVIQIDSTVTPPTIEVTVFGGGVYGAATARSPQSGERINLTTLSPVPSWTRTADMNFPRTNVNAVLLPDGTVFVVGGQRNGKWDTDPQPVLQAEIYDPQTNTFTVTPAMAHPRQYHSVAVLLPDGRVLTAGGVDPSPGVIERDLRSMEIFSPSYLDRGPRPVITASPGSVAYGNAFDVSTADPAQIEQVYLIRPCAVTHHTDAGQRSIKLSVEGRTAATVTVRAPADGNVAPPGYYMLFIVDGNGVPSVAAFIRVE